VVVAVVATALPTPVATIKQQSWQLQNNTNDPNRSGKETTSAVKGVVAIVAAVAAALPTPAVTTTEFKPKEVLQKLKNLFSKAT
jgi:hypothetical protein